MNAECTQPTTKDDCMRAIEKKITELSKAITQAVAQLRALDAERSEAAKQRIRLICPLPEILDQPESFY